MMTKYFIFLLIGVLFATVMSAQDLQSDERKAQSGSGHSVHDTVFPQSGDSADAAFLAGGRQINIPFAKSSAKFLAGDITVINPEEILPYDNLNTIIDIFAGRVPGYYGNLNLRGIGNALVVVDGMPRAISEVNISEVAQITILKDANSAILYGVQANNGVILITTKRGRPGKNEITAMVETGLNDPVSYPAYLKSADYMEWYNKALVNDGLTPLYDQGFIAETRKGDKPHRYPDIDYYSSDFLKNYKPATRVETEFSYGGKNAQFYTQLGWNRTGSLYNLGKPAHTDRLNLRSNLDMSITDHIRSHVDIATIFNISNMPAGNFFNDVTTLKPNDYLPLIDTSFVADKNQIKTAKLINGRYMLGGTSLYTNNVYGNLILGGYNRQINTTGMLNVGLDFDLNFLLKGLSFKTNSSFSFYNQFSEVLTNSYAVYEPVWTVGEDSRDIATLTKIGLDKFSGEQQISNTSLSRDYAVSGTLDYACKPGKEHTLAATVMGYLDNYHVTSVFQSDKHAHLGTRIDYRYKDRYIVNFNSAIASSPKLPPGHRVGFSPSLALGWIISGERFLRKNVFANYLKLNVSAGIINTDMSLSKYYTYEDVLTGSSSYGWGDGYRTGASTIFSSIANDKLFYEKRKEINIGAEAVLFRQSLWMNVNYFRESKSDQIILSGLGNTIPSYLGGLNPAVNYNEDRYSGFELGMSWKKTVRDFRIELGASALFLKSETVKRDEFYGEDYLYRQGKPTYAIFGLESLGLFRDEADIESHATQMFGTVKPGDIKYKDQNNDGRIDSNDEIMIGDWLASFAGGLTFKVSYKSLSLFLVSSATNGAQTQFSNSYYWVSGDVKYSKSVLNSWTSETAETATYPRLSSKANSNNFRTSTFWLEENSRITLNRAQLTYDLPTSLATKLFTRHLSVYCRANNLLTIAKNKDKMELNIGSEPQYRYYALGVKVGF